MLYSLSFYTDTTRLPSSPEKMRLSTPQEQTTLSVTNPPDWSCDFEGIIPDCGVERRRFIVNTHSFKHTTGPTSGNKGSGDQFYSFYPIMHDLFDVILIQIYNFSSLPVDARHWSGG